MIGYDDLGDAGVGERVPGVLDLGEPRHVGHRAAGREVGQHDLLLRRGEDVGRLGHEVHAAEDDVLRLRPRSGVARELERVAGDVGELDHLVALVVVPEHEDLLAEPLLGPARPSHQVGVGGGRQVAGALDAALGGAVGAQAQGEATGGRRSTCPKSPIGGSEASRQDGPMRVVFAPDKFAGTLSAVEAAEAMASGWARGLPTTSSCRCRCPTAVPGSSTYCMSRWAASCRRSRSPGRTASPPRPRCSGSATRRTSRARRRSGCT